MSRLLSRYFKNLNEDLCTGLMIIPVSDNLEVILKLVLIHF